MNQVGGVIVQDAPRPTEGVSDANALDAPDRNSIFICEPDGQTTAPRAPAKTDDCNVHSGGLERFGGVSHMRLYSANYWSVVTSK
jgi:hypothetical protein